MKKLSIITICYNEPDLEKTCKSIVNQTWQNFEWIVIDGASAQETLDIFEKYKYRIDKFISEPDNGIYNAVNKGLKLAECEWINILNAGDCYHSNDVLEKVFSKEYEADVLYGEQYSVYKNNPKKSHINKFPDILDDCYFINHYLDTPAMFIKRNLFEEYGYFSEEYKIVSDFEKWIIFQKNGKSFRHLDLIIVDFDMNGISSNPKNKALHRYERKLAINKYYTPQEILLHTPKYKKLSLIERIFSITNSYDYRHKIITILGFHLKIRRSTNA